MQFIDQFRAARRVSTPILCVRTPDPAATIGSIGKIYNGSAPPMLTWDIARGLVGWNAAGKEVVQLMYPQPEMVAMSTNLTDMLGQAAEQLPEKCIIFALNAHRVINEQGVSQAVWNCRDKFKANFRTLVLMCPDITLPAEIAQDVLMLDEPLPTNAQLKNIITGVLASAGVPATEELLTAAVDALCGVAAFPAEQVTAMSLQKSGSDIQLDLDEVWELKRKMIEATKGLSVWRGGETFADIGGCDNVKYYLEKIIAGRQPPRAIVFMDEIEKAMGGVGTDTSGVSTEMLGTLLTWMQDNQADGSIFIGPPGAAKSAIAKAFGNTARRPTIQFDLSAMKGSLVGESGAALRQALKVVQAVAQGQAYFVATCNSIGQLPPELRRRFTDTTFFFDLPTQEERDVIWKIYCKKFGVGGDLPDDTGWTGAEIRNCVRNAWRLGISILDASRYIVPVCRSAADKIEALRKEANGRFTSASHPGVYTYAPPQAAERGRQIDFSGGI